VIAIEHIPAPDFAGRDWLGRHPAANAPERKRVASASK
jgi:hypothetical protein